MVTLVGTQSDFFYALKELAELLYELTETLTAASTRLENEKYKKAVDEMIVKAREYVHAVNSFLQGKGRETATGPSGAQLLSIGRVAIAQMMGDKSILSTLVSVMKDVETAYNRLCDRAQESEDVTKILRGGLDEVRLEVGWLKKEAERS